jgi:hypothetical protein
MRLVKLDKDTAVLVVHIPDNQETPFITKDGRIYRRLGDSSDPVPENDRHAVDRLVDNGREITRRFERFCQDERAFCKAEEGQAWVNLYLSPYPLGVVRRFDILEDKGIDALIKLSQNPTKIYVEDSVEVGEGNLPFNSVQAEFGSVILRQVEPSDLAYNALSMELFPNGRAKFFVPLQFVSVFPDQKDFKSLKAQNALQRIWHRDQGLDVSLLRFIDIADLWLAYVNLLNFYQEWLRTEGLPARFLVNISLEGVWRSVPFCDVDQWGEHLDKLGLPVLNKDTLKFPDFKWTVDGNKPLWITICPIIAMGFGLSLSFSSNALFTVLEQASEEKNQ